MNFFSADPPDPLAAARRRGREALVRLKEAEGGAWPETCMLSAVGISVEAADDMAGAYGLVRWVDTDGTWCYPKWQFASTGRRLPGIEAVLTIFKSDDHWRVLRYFLSPMGELENRSPLHWLRRGHVSRVIDHARRHRAGNTW